MNAQQLRNSLLQEAIQGRLVPQDPNDEPASVLLQRIRKEKEHLVKEGKLKKKDLESKPIEKDEIPFEIPKSWEWCKLGDVGIFERGNGIRKDEVTEIGYPCVRYGEMYTKYKFSPTFSQTYSHTSLLVFDKCRKANRGDLFMALTGENKQDIALAAQYVGDEEIAVGGDLCHFTVLEAYALFFVYLINSIYFSSKKELLATGNIIVHISTDKLASIPIPLPPLAEQKRIVAKLEELMPIVERYGRAQEELDKLNESLPARLRQSILQEAIQGRLVPQGPNDEPASELLKRIRKEKEQLVKEGKLKKKDLESKPIEDDEIPFEIPKGWEWCHFGDIVNMQMGKTPPRGDARYWIDGAESWVSISDMTDYGHITSTKEKVSQYAVNNTFKQISPIGTLLMSFKLTVGRTSILNIPAFHNEAIISIYPYVDIDYAFRNYLFYVLPLLANLGDSKDAIKGKTLNSNSLNNLMIPYPPLAEQKRIVAKIEELFGVIE